MGVDLEEAPLGGLVERLLTDEELEMLADGGPPDDASAESGGENDDAGDRNVQADDAATDAADATRARADESTDATADRARADAATARERSSSIDLDIGDADEGSETEDEDDGGPGLRERLKPLLFTGAIVLALLAVIALVLYRYLDTVKEVVPNRIVDTSGEDDADDDLSALETDEPAETDADASPARRRAKVGEAEPDREVGAATATEVDAPTDESDGVAAPDADVDVGALVGLGFLALVAALVRKFSEERPSDPLVDGPEQ